MKYFYLLLTLFVVGCSASPAVIPDISKPSLIAEILRKNTAQPSYFWILWYLPVLVVVLCWSYNYFIRKDSNGSKEISKQSVSESINQPTG